MKVEISEPNHEPRSFGVTWIAEANPVSGARKKKKLITNRASVMTTIALSQRG
jgi:hypothetical protein